jgi:cell division transport system ATP-binding protein
MLVDYQKINICQGGELILKDVEFSVDTDQFIYIIGKVGSGKSSLLKTMYCELDIPKQETQKAEVLGRDLLTLKRREIPALRKEMGIIFQDFQLLHDRSVFKNLQFILHSTGWKSNKDINNRIEQVLSDVGMSDKKDKYPHELSGGEQQRIAIARAVLNTPKIIIADEPTGNLDPETANNIVELLRKITESGTSVIMSTHNISMLKKYPGIIYKCEDGSLTNITNEYYNAQKV